MSSYSCPRSTKLLTEAGVVFSHRRRNSLQISSTEVHRKEEIGLLPALRYLMTTPAEITAEQVTAAVRKSTIGLLANHLVWVLGGARVVRDQWLRSVSSPPASSSR